MDHLLEESLLYDYYGELLTDRQKEIYEQYVVEDLSLGEIAEMTGISRQAVHDQIRRVQKVLQTYEDKLHLVERFLSIKMKLEEMERGLVHLSENMQPNNSNQAYELINKLHIVSQEIKDEL